MKNIQRILTLGVCLVLVQLAACKNDADEPTAREKAIATLTKASWGHAHVTHSDGDLSDQYENFVIQFIKAPASGFDGTFIITAGGYAFAETAGRWKFNNGLDQISFDSGKVMAVALTVSDLQLEFYVAAPAAKAMGVSGNFVFNLQPL